MHRKANRRIALGVALVAILVSSFVVLIPTARAAGPPTQVVITMGDAQTATVGTQFATTLNATIEDASNTPVPTSGVTVDFTPVTGGGGASGSISNVTTTDGSGVATATLTANTKPGSFTITASSTGLTSGTFSETNTVDVPTKVVPTGGDGNTAQVLTAFPILKATIEDQFDNPVPNAGVTVNFAPTTGGGGASGLISGVTTTDPSGVATAFLTANSHPGAYTVSASSGVLTSGTFHETNSAGPASQIAIAAGDAQKTRIGTAFGSPLSVTVKDSLNNPLSGKTVTFTLTPGASGASASFSGGNAAITNGSGVATSNTLTANGVSGPFTVVASAAGVGGPATFNETNSTVPGIPTNVTAASGNNSASVHWTNPPDGSSPITGYVIIIVTPPGLAPVTVNGIATSATVGGLTNETSYTFTVTAVNANGSGPASAPSSPVVPSSAGYWLVASDGGIFSYGSNRFYGSTGGFALNQPIVGMASTPSGLGYWLVASDGGIFTYGDAVFYGSTGSLHLNRPIVGMAATPDGGGYWLVASDGGIFSFGNAKFHGSTGALHLNRPIVGMATTPLGKGYWLVASDGGIFSFGSARFLGSAGGFNLNSPIVGMAAPDAGGYWLVASDGGIFSYGDAGFYGSAGSLVLNRPIVGMEVSTHGHGYWLAASDGGIFTYGDAVFHGSAGSLSLNQPIVAMG